MLSYAPFLSRHVASLVMEINNLLFIPSDEYFHYRSCFVFSAVTEYCFIRGRHADSKGGWCLDCIVVRMQDHVTAPCGLEASHLSTERQTLLCYA